MQLSAREGISCYDFLAGDNQLKRSLSNQCYAMSSVSFAKAGAGALFERALRAVRNILDKERGPHC